jgi:opacity protein-like surface antigen
MQSMKSFRFLSFLAVALILTPAVLAADFGVRGGRYSDIGEEFIGAEMLFDLGAVNLNPNIEYALADDITAGSANIDLTFDIGKFSHVTPYVGAGLGVWYVDDDLGDNTTDLLGNLIGGVQFDLDYLKPYAQVKYFRTIDHDDGGSADDLAFTIGLRF